MAPVLPPEEDTVNDPNIFRILITNDNHVGFKEDDKIRSRDALATFEEIFSIARLYNVDFVLHSGDLFDDSRPNRFWLNSVCNVFTRYCFGDNAVGFEQLRSDDSKLSNFEDPNLNVALPVYFIHGNHDDLGGEFGDNRPLSCGDLLETVKLINYFGKQENVEESIDVKPLLFQKGDARLALYGLGNVRDDRLYRMFQSKKVNFMAPEANFFSLMAIHQNRYKGSLGGVPAKNCVHPVFLPSFMNLVVWAHEHECIPSVEQSVEAGFHILQSGSSVATSLSIGEQAAKHVFLLEVNADHKFRITPIPLFSVRPMVMDELIVPSNMSLSSPQGEQVLVAKVEEMIERGRQCCDAQMKNFSTFRPPEMLFRTMSPELPLVRLKVVMSGKLSSPSNPLPNGHILNQKFGRQFLNRLANPEDILQLVVPKSSGITKPRQSGIIQLELEDTVLSSSTSGQSQEKIVQDLIFNYMQNAGLLDVLVEPDFNIAVQDFVHKNDIQAIDRFVKTQIEEITKMNIQEGTGDVGSIQDQAKQRASSLRAERLARAIAEQNNGEEPPREEIAREIAPETIINSDHESETDLLFFATDGGDVVVPAAVATKRDRPLSDSENEEHSSFSDEEVFANARGKPAPKRKATKAAKPAPKTKAPPGNTLAAFLSQQSAAKAAPAGAPRSQWARRM